ncbi:MAG: transcription factor FapR [Bacillota bacterium]
MSRESKIERQSLLKQYLEENPFSTDEELAEYFTVSVQTIRLDRISLGIPELRERLRCVAEEKYSNLKSLTEAELVGELVDITLDKEAYSILDIHKEHVLEKTGIARGHHLFAQANSLAIAVVDADVVLTGSARVRYKRPVHIGERVVCKAVVKVKRGNTYLVSVYSKVEGELVFKGQYIVLAQSEK